MKNFLIIEHDGYLDEFTIKAGKDKGLTLYIVTQNPEPWLLNYIDEENIIVTNTEDIYELLFFLTDYSNNKNIHFSGVGTFFEKYVLHTSKIAEKFNLIGVNFESANYSSRNKFLMRKKCFEAGIRQPYFINFSLHEKEKVIEFVNRYGKSVVKPSNGAGSIGVFLIDNADQIDLIFENIELQIKDERNVYVPRNHTEFIVETYIEGDLISIDGLIQNDKIYFIGETEFFMSEEPMFIQEGGITPTMYKADEIKSFQDYVARIIKTIGFSNCGFHCELRINKNEPFLIEIACRTPGGPLLLNYKHSNGIDGVDIIYDIFLGNKVSVSKTKSLYLIHKDVYTSKEGRVVSINIPPEIKYIEGLIEIIEFANLGDIVTANSNYPTSLFYYSAVADSRDKVFELSKKIEESISYEIK